jgi:hypothetical protein
MKEIPELPDRNRTQFIPVWRRCLSGGTRVVQFTPSDQNVPLLALTHEAGDVKVVAREVSGCVEKVDEITPAQNP